MEQVPAISRYSIEDSSLDWNGQHTIDIGVASFDTRYC